MRSKRHADLHRDETGKVIAGVGPGVGLEFIKAYFPQARTIRVASAYFSLAGYKIGREHSAPDVQFHVLVGKEEGANVRKAVIDEIRAELQGCETTLWESVNDLVNRMELGKFTIKDARAMQVPFHCKFFVCDDEVLWHGSANFSKNGILYNAEQITATFSHEEITLFARWYDSVAREAHNLLSDLLNLLKQWLEMASPFDAYLKILLALSNLPERTLRSGAHVPTYYQKAVVARAMTQIEEFGGALIVLATGLGKTVVGAELANHLLIRGEVDNVVLLAPEAVREAWTAELSGRNINPWFFPTNVLFRQDSRRRHHQVHQVNKRLRQADARMLIVIDEAHFYRNQLLSQKQKKRPSLVFARLRPAANAGAKIVLLTATAYGTNIKNFDSLLHILPHRQKGPLDIPGPWQANSPDDFRRLPVVTILGLPDVLGIARRRGDVDADGRPFVSFGEEHRYLPSSVKLIPVSYELPLQERIQAAFDASYFSHAVKIPQLGYDDDIGEYETASDAAYNTALNSWLSSPLAMKDFVDQNLATLDVSEQLALSSEINGEISPLELLTDPLDEEQIEIPGLAATDDQGCRSWGYGKGYAPFLVRHDLRRKLLEPLSETLPGAADHKLQELLRIVRACCQPQRGKVLVFVRMHKTAVYVTTHLQKALQLLRIGCTVEDHGGKVGLKSREARNELLRQFAPDSNEEKDVSAEEEYDVLICTDADGVGVNLQDADAVVNYDHPSGADVLFQRAGRVLRMTPRPDRIVRIFTLIPSVAFGAPQPGVYGQIRERFLRLTRRHDRSSEILGSSTLAASERLDLFEERSLDIKEWFRHGDLASSFAAADERSFAAHMSRLESHRERAEGLAEPLHTARASAKLAEARVAVLFSTGGALHLVLYDPIHNRLDESGEQEILALVSCDDNEQRAFVKFSEVERLANEAVRLWCEQHNEKADGATKICAVYLQPHDEIPGYRQLMMAL